MPAKNDDHCASTATGLGALWVKSAAEDTETTEFQGDRETDLAILGGGFTGCSAALEAAGQGADVVLLEAETIGHGGSGRNVGLVNAGLWLPPDAVCDRLGPTQGERLNRALAEGPELVFDLIERHGIACEPQRAGTLHLAHSKRGLADLEERRGQLSARGAPVAMLTGAQTSQRTGTDAFFGALHDSRAGTVQPLAYARGLARAAQAAGAELHEASPAVSAEYRSGHWIIRTARGKLRAARLLVATNAYHRPVAQAPMPSVPIVNFFQIATEPLGDNMTGDILPGGEGCWDTGMIMTALRRDAAGRVILGGMGDDVGIQAGWAKRKLKRLFPRLADTPIDHAWAGRIAMTSDHLPRILRMGPRGLSIFGYSGRGIAPGTVFGKAAAQALLSEREDMLPLVPVTEHREPLHAVKSAVYEFGARMVHLAAARSRRGG